jgi:glycosyltransferase involved in cell wall biosynthesis
MKPKYLMISSEVRRDLEKPLAYFEQLEVWHLYNRAPWNDMRPEDFTPRSLRFRFPWDLFLHLSRIKPDIIQGPEPMSALMFPYLMAVLLYLWLNPKTKLVTASLEAIPLEKKYPYPIFLPMKKMLPIWFRRSSVVFYLEHGALYNLTTYGATEDKLVYHLYGCWGVDFDEFNPEGEAYKYPPAKPVITCVARHSPIKGVHHLIEAYKILRDKGLNATLALIGDGSERVNLEAQAKATGYGNDIIFHGLVKHAELPYYLRGADIFALPSTKGKIWTQQLSTATWQAMACGLPLVVTHIGRMEEFTPPEAGYLVPERDPAAMAEALARLVGDPVNLRRMSEGALGYARKRFTDRKNVAIAEQIILERCGFGAGEIEERGKRKEEGEKQKITAKNQSL